MLSKFLGLQVSFGYRDVRFPECLKRRGAVARKTSAGDSSYLHPTDRNLYSAVISSSIY